MKLRPAFGLSLLAALGIHAAILLVPRLAAPREIQSLPAVVIDLSEAPVVQATSTAFRPAPRPAGAPLEPMPAESARARAAEPLPEPAPAPEPRPEPAQPAEAPALAQAEEAPQAVAQPAPPAPEDSAPSLLPPVKAPRDPAVNAVPAAAAVPSYSGGASETPGARSGSTADSRPGSTANQSFQAGLIAPRLLSAIRPAYPRAARESGAQGLVKVSVTLDDRGAVTAVEVLVSSGSTLLDRAALDAVRQAAFSPALQDGKPVACRLPIPIRFKISGASP